MRRRAEARTAWLVYKTGFGFSLYLGVTTFTLALIERIDAGPLTLALVGTTLEVSYSLAEVPTGVLADRYGRKPSLVIGLAVIAAAFAFVVIPELAVVLVAQVFLGAGWTCLSGADVAWITDEVGEAAARPLYAAGTRAELLGSVVGIGAGAALGQLELWVPLAASAASFGVLALWVGLRLAETAPARTHEDRLTVAETLRRTRASIRSRRGVALVLVLTVAAGLGGEGVDRLWQFHLFADDAGRDETVLAVAGLFAAGLLLGAAATTVVARLLHGGDPDAPRRWLTVANAGVAASVLLLAVAPWGVAAAALVVSNGLRHACEPLVTAWVNRGADARTRATLNSLVGQAESAGEVAGGPMLGAVGATAGVPTALVSSAVVFGVGALLTAWRPALRGVADDAAAPEPVA